MDKALLLDAVRGLAVLGGAEYHVMRDETSGDVR